MTDTALAAAVTRLECAIARLERTTPAWTTAPPPPAPDAALARLPDPALALLEERHARLRARVAETVERLDALIAAGVDAG